MELVEIDVVGAEALERAVEGALDVEAVERGVAAPDVGNEIADRLVGAAHLSGDNQRVAAAPALEPAAEQRFGRTVGHAHVLRQAVGHLRQVEEIDPAVDGAVEQREARAVV